WDALQYHEAWKSSNLDLNRDEVSRNFCKQIHKIKENGTEEEKQNARRLKSQYKADSKKMGRIYNFWLRYLPELSNNLGENEQINTGNLFLSCNLSFDGAQLASTSGTGNIVQGREQSYKIQEQSGIEEPPSSRLRKRNRSINYTENSSKEETDSEYDKLKRVKKGSTRSSTNVDEDDESESEAITTKLNKLKKRLESQSRNEWIVDTINVTRKFKEYQIQLIENVIKGRVKITWNDKYEVLALASIIVLIKSCPYYTFTPYEWKKIINTNPYTVKESFWTNTFASSLSEACDNVAIGLDGNFVLNDGNDLAKKASRIFNNLKEDLPSVQTKGTTENEHRFNYLDPLLRPFFCGDSKDYEVRLDKSIKPLGCTELQKDKDFVKVHLRSKRTINQLLNEGRDDVNSYIMDLQYDGIYRSYPLLATKLVTEKALFPMLGLSYHIDKVEKHVQRIANEFLNRRSSHYNLSEQIEYIIEEPGSSEFKELLSSLKFSD
ncbi:20542_t:CDS:10, partial [Gigaspora margarita]